MLDRPRVKRTAMERVFDRERAKTTARFVRQVQDGEYCDGAWEFAVTSSIEDLASRVGKLRAIAFVEAQLRMMRL